MEALQKYGKRFLIGFTIGLAVMVGMSMFGALGLVTFAASNPVSHTLYAGLFFGTISLSTAIINDIFDHKKLEQPALQSVGMHHSVERSPNLNMEHVPQKSAHRDRVMQEREQPDAVIQR